MPNGQRTGPETDPKDRARLRRMDKEINDIMGSDAFLDVLVEATTDDNALKALMANPKAHLQGKRITVPDEVDVTCSKGSVFTLCYSYYFWGFRITRCYTY